MAQKTVFLEGVGPILLSKRRGTKNIRLSVRADGVVRVGLPAWLPYSAGLNFAKSRQNWINKHLNTAQPALIKSGDSIGKTYTLQLNYDSSASRTSSRIRSNLITVTTPWPVESQAAQTKIQAVCERALKLDAHKLLPGRLDALSAQYNLNFKQLRIVKLRSRWGSCSQTGVITLNYYLLQLPWELIDYVILHELAHTQHLNHSRQFWFLVENSMPDAKLLRQDIKRYNPVLKPA